MMPAAKHGDPQMGVDIHLCVVPPSPSPVPLPTPHMSIVFDPFDYVPYIGGTVTVCGMKRATAGTNATVVHIPPGFPFAPKLPDKDDELFMGSATVCADGDPFSFLGVPVLGCQVAGMISIPRLKKKNNKAMLLPTTFNIAIPTNVFVGGPPTISLMGLAMKGVFSALGKFAKSGLFKRMRQKLFGHLKPGFLKCVILRAEPVNIITGEVSVEQDDFTLPGRIPIQWPRSYSSGNRRAGLCGLGWETPGDGRLEVDPLDGHVLMHYPRVGPLSFDSLPLAEGDEAAELELMDGALLSDHGGEYRVRTKEDRIYHFAKDQPYLRLDGQREYPLVRISDLCGNWLHFHRQGRYLLSIEESTGRRIVVETENGRIAGLTLYVPGTDVRHEYVRYEYENGDLAAVVDALGNPYRFAYDEHHLVRHTDRNGLSFYYAYERRPDGWRVLHSWGDGGLYDYHFAYSDDIRERRITDSLGHVSIVKLDERDLPISEIDPLGGLTAYEYDDVGRTVAVTDPMGNRTTYDYDRAGNRLAIGRPDGSIIATTFDQANKPVTVVDPAGGTWVQRWDPRGLVVEQVTPLGTAVSYSYDSLGQLVSFIGQRGGRIGLQYDATGNLAQWTNATGEATRYAHDDRGNLLRAQSSTTETFHYDLADRIISIERATGNRSLFSYDAEGNVVQWVDENGHATAVEYCGLGMVSRRVFADGHSVSYCYDSEERLVGVINERSERYEFVRDPLGRIVKEIDYWRAASHYCYNASGHLCASTNPLGETIRYGTDALGRVVRKVLPDGSHETFAYNANGHLQKAVNRERTVEWTRDPDGRLVEERQGSFVLTSSYDASGNRIGRKTGDGHTVSFDFDLSERVSSIQIDQELPIRIHRDGGGRIRREELSATLSRDLEYDLEGRLVSQVVAGALQPMFGTRYHYDASGNLLSREDAELGTESYWYDPLNRVRAHLDGLGRRTEFLSDACGDQLVAAQSDRSGHHGLDRPLGSVDKGSARELSCRGVRYRFDRAGRLVERREADRTLWLDWDANQRLCRTDSGGVVTRYGYDAIGRRIYKETEGRRTEFFWDGDVLLAEQEQALSSSGASILADRQYVYYPATSVPLAMVTAQPEAPGCLLYHNDPNGCPTRLTSTGGATLWGVSYSVFGRVEAVHDATIENPIRFQGHYFDVETGLHYNRHRYYDPHAGQFIARDPIGLVGGSNVYRAGRNPFVSIDPLGLTACSVAKAKELAENVPAKFKELFQCKEFAASLKKAIQGEGLHAEEIVLKSDTGLIFSDAAGKVISTNGDHVGIKVGDQVFDNLNPQGIHVDKWMEDLGVGFPGMRDPSLIPF